MNQPPINRKIDSSLLEQTLQSSQIYIKKTLFQAQQYFSPFRYSTEDQLIHEISSLGDQIDLIERQLSLSKEKKIIKIIKTQHHSLSKQSIKNHGKNNKNIPQTIKNTKNIPTPKTQPIKTNKLNTIKPKISSFLTQSRQKINPSHNQNKKQIHPFQYTQRNHNQELKEHKNTKKIQKKVTAKFDQNIQPSYHNFRQKKIEKLVKQLKQEKEILQQKNQNLSKKIKNDIKNEKQKTSELVKQTESLNDSFCSRGDLSKQKQKLSSNHYLSLFEHSRIMLLRKQEKIQKHRQQKIEQEIQQTTFTPMTFTSNYKSKNVFVSEKRNLKNFVKRQEADRQLRRKNHFKQLKQVMQECSFKPRLNVNSKHSQSIVKQIWRSASLQQRSLSKSIERKSIEKFQINQPIKPKQKNEPNAQKLTVQNKISINDSLNNSKRSTLFNQSTQISIHDTNQLSFLLK